jgi:hypothetical protein
MSRITLSGNASGTGNFTLASPNSNTDRTLTLPDATGTVVVSGATPELSGVYLGGSGSANLLDDYEEGTWTPAFKSGTWTYGERFGEYIRVGDLITVWFRIAWTAKSGSGAMIITGLPFTPFAGRAGGRSGGSYGTLEGVDTSGDKNMVLALDADVSEFYMRFMVDNGTWTSVELGNANSTGEVQGSMTYRA